MFALDEDTAEDYAVLAEKLERTGVCVVLSSIAVPIYGTPLHRKMSAEGRILDKDLSHYEGDHLVFRHPHLSAAEIQEAYAASTALLRLAGDRATSVRFLSSSHGRRA